MGERDDELLLEEIQCCQNDEDIQSLVDSQCLDIIGYSFQDQLKLAHKQLFRIIKLFKEHLLVKPFKQFEVKKKIPIHQAFEENKRIINYELQLQQHQLKLKQIEQENYNLKCQLNLYEGDFDCIRSQNFEDVKKLEEQLLKTLNSISLYKNSLIQKFCVICLQKEYCMIFKPCGHVCVCEECSEKIMLCPVDRSQIIKKKKIYLS